MKQSVKTQLNILIKLHTEVIMKFMGVGMMGDELDGFATNTNLDTILRWTALNWN